MTAENGVIAWVLGYQCANYKGCITLCKYLVHLEYERQKALK